MHPLPHPNKMQILFACYHNQVTNVLTQPVITEIVFKSLVCLLCHVLYFSFQSQMLLWLSWALYILFIRKFGVFKPISTLDLRVFMLLETRILQSFLVVHYQPIVHLCWILIDFVSETSIHDSCSSWRKFGSLNFGNLTEIEQ